MALSLRASSLLFQPKTLLYITPLASAATRSFSSNDSDADIKYLQETDPNSAVRTLSFVQPSAYGTINRHPNKELEIAYCVRFSDVYAERVIAKMGRRNMSLHFKQDSNSQ